MVGAEEDDDAVGLGVEGGGDLVEQVLDDLLDAGGGDGEVLVQGVVGPALLGEVDEVLGGGGHVCGGGGEETVVIVVVVVVMVVMLVLMLMSGRGGSASCAVQGERRGRGRYKGLEGRRVVRNESREGAGPIHTATRTE